MVPEREHEQQPRLRQDLWAWWEDQSGEELLANTLRRKTGRRNYSLDSLYFLTVLSILFIVGWKPAVVDQ